MLIAANRGSGVTRGGAMGAPAPFCSWKAYKIQAQLYRRPLDRQQEAHRSDSPPHSRDTEVDVPQVMDEFARAHEAQEYSSRLASSNCLEFTNATALLQEITKTT